ncbi:MAG TPA: adenylyl-sulfate kinase [Candidatus Acidoferrales bacterium]|nr:adenylyl-sulfate kinase [Candidatus Acidoferrales bacterium]
MATTEKHKGFTLWFTGLPCSGKSTLAVMVAGELKRRGRGAEILDGDEVRKHLTKGLGFSREDRDENIRRIGYVCRLLSRNGAVAIAAAISPYRAVRDEVRAGHESGRFIEVFVNAPLEVCIERDVKGMYKKALAGEIKQFTGVDDPYEAPLAPELAIETSAEAALESAARILGKLEQLGLVEPAQEPTYTPEEAEKIRERLTRLGYIEQ